MQPDRPGRAGLENQNPMLPDHPPYSTPEGKRILILGAGMLDNNIQRCSVMVRNVLKMSEKGGGPAGYTQADIEGMEKEALEKANKAIGSIENAMAVWNSTKEKPADLSFRMDRLKHVYETLTSWEKKALLGMSRPEDLTAKVERLREFSDICYSLNRG